MIEHELVAAYAALQDDGLINGAAGNISMRVGDGDVLVTPSGIPPQLLTPAQICRIDLASGTQLSGAEPSSELPLHLAVLRRFPWVRAIVHTHSPHATAFACARRPLDFIMNESLAVRAPRVLCTETYAPPGSPQLAEEVVATFSRQQGSRAILIASHGLVALGDRLDVALSVARAVEWQAKVALLAQLLGGPVALDSAAQRAIAATYGVPA